jgi:hypothetical protein
VIATQRPKTLTVAITGRAESLGHSQEHAKLVPGVREVDQNHSLEEERAHGDVAQVFGDVQDDSELLAEVIEALLSGMQPPGLLASEEQLDSIGEEGIVVFALDETFENLLVRRVYQRLEDEHERDHVLDLAPCKSDRRTPIGEVVDRVGAGGLVRSDTSDLAPVRRIRHTALGETGSVQVQRVVPAGDDEVPDELLVAVDDEVSAKRGGLLATLDHLGGGHAGEVAPRGLEVSGARSDLERSAEGEQSEEGERSGIRTNSEWRNWTPWNASWTLVGGLPSRKEGPQGRVENLQRRKRCRSQATLKKDREPQFRPLRLPSLHRRTHPNHHRQEPTLLRLEILPTLPVLPSDLPRDARSEFRAVRRQSLSRLGGEHASLDRELVLVGDKGLGEVDRVDLVCAG